MKKTKILVTFLIILIVIQIFGIAGVLGYKMYINKQAKEQCAVNRNKIMNMSKTFMETTYQKHPREANYPSSLEELNKKYNLEHIKCPSGGKYFWDPLNGKVFCNIKSHQE